MMRLLARSTKGGSEQVRLLDGVHCTHIIYPRTGWPMNTLVSKLQTDVSQDSLQSDSGSPGDAVARHCPD